MKMRHRLESKINTKSEIKMDIKKGLIFCTPYGTYKCATDKDFIKNNSNLIERVLFTTSSVIFNLQYVVLAEYFLRNYFK